MQNLIEIQLRNLQLLCSGGFRPPHPSPRLDRCMESPRLDRVKHKENSALWEKFCPVEESLNGLSGYHLKDQIETEALMRLQNEVAHSDREVLSSENGKTSTINTHFLLSLLQNESEINYFGK